MTSAHAQLWDRFADEVLPWVGLAELPFRLQSACPALAPERIDFWVRRFNSINVAVAESVASDEAGWTNDEAGGVWFDRMKAVALSCIEETVRTAAG